MSSELIQQLHEEYPGQITIRYDDGEWQIEHFDDGSFIDVDPETLETLQDIFELIGFPEHMVIFAEAFEMHRIEQDDGSDIYTFNTDELL